MWLSDGRQSWKAADVGTLSLPLKGIRVEDHQSDRACSGDKAREAQRRWSGHGQRRDGENIRGEDAGV